ncbi:MAG: TOBE domain-containing protein [Caulobacteraceae bacterium]
MLALDAPTRISARNVLPGVVQTVEARDGRALVRVAHEGRALLAALTPDAVLDLGLKPGVAVHAVVKSVAVDGLGGGLLEVLDG